MLLGLYAIQSQGQVEITNKLIEERLKKMLASSTVVDWDLFLAKAIFDINCRVVDSIEISSMEALMGYVGQTAVRRSIEDDLFHMSSRFITPVTIEMSGSMARFVCLRKSA